MKERQQSCDERDVEIKRLKDLLTVREGNLKKMKEEYEKQVVENRDLVKKLATETPDKGSFHFYKEDYPLAVGKEAMRPNASPDFLSSKIRSGGPVRPKVQSVLSAVKSQNMRDSAKRAEYLNQAEQSSSKHSDSGSAQQRHPHVLDYYKKRIEKLEDIRS